MTSLLLKTTGRDESRPYIKIFLALLIGATLLFVGCKDSHGSDDDGDITDMDEYEIEDEETENWCRPEPEADYDYDYDPGYPPDADLVCTPNVTEPCQYTGPQGTENVGTCKAGTRTCLPDGSGWMTCFGEVTPLYDLCDDGIDQDCNGIVDDLDVDGDGYIECGETLDCCWKFEDCPEPWNVYPGAPEIPGNGIDDNCNGEIDEITDDDELLPPDE